MPQQYCHEFQEEYTDSETKKLVEAASRAERQAFYLLPDSYYEVDVNLLRIIISRHCRSLTSLRCVTATHCIPMRKTTDAFLLSRIYDRKDLGSRASFQALFYRLDKILLETVYNSLEVVAVSFNKAQEPYCGSFTAFSYDPIKESKLWKSLSNLVRLERLEISNLPGPIRSQATHIQELVKSLPRLKILGIGFAKGIEDDDQGDIYERIVDGVSNSYNSIEARFPSRLEVLKLGHTGLLSVLSDLVGENLKRVFLNIQAPDDLGHSFGKGLYLEQLVLSIPDDLLPTFSERPLKQWAHSLLLTNIDTFSSALHSGLPSQSPLCYLRGVMDDSEIPKIPDFHLEGLPCSMKLIRVHLDAFQRRENH